MKSSNSTSGHPLPVEEVILTLRGQKVILDADLAALYQTTTKKFNQQVKRNLDRFPQDFMFQLTKEETQQLKLSKPAVAGIFSSETGEEAPKRSQNVTALTKYRNIGSPPRAFTEHGAIMAATLLNSPEAISMSVYVVRAFIQMRTQISANADVLKRLAEIDQTLLKHDKSLQILWQQLQPLLLPPPATPKRPIGFHP